MTLVFAAPFQLVSASRLVQPIVTAHSVSSIQPIFVALVPVQAVFVAPFQPVFADPLVAVIPVSISQPIFAFRPAAVIQHFVMTQPSTGVRPAQLTSLPQPQPFSASLAVQLSSGQAPTFSRLGPSTS